MIDHVTIRVEDLASSSRFYRRALELLQFEGDIYESSDFLEWNDFSIAQATPERPATRRIHLGFRAHSRAQVDHWWQAMTTAGYPDDGPPGPRPEYAPHYYGGFLTDPDGNSVEAVHNPPARNQDGVIDHLWLRVQDLAASTRFYTTITPTLAHQTTRLPGRTMIHGEGASFSLLEGNPSENVHLAFSAADQASVNAFHQTGIDAGYTTLGAPGERPQYHPGYYAAYLADPDLHNIEAVFHNRTL